jgi:sigma-E factor negative regulatory protein RseC
MLEEGLVREVRDNGAIARVEVQVSAVCASCGNRGSCAADAEHGSRVVLDARNAAGASPGERVRIEMNPENVWLAAFLVFVLPVLFIMGGYALGCVGGVKSVWPYVGAAVGLVAWMALVLSAGRRLRRSRAFRPTVIQILERAPARDETR